MSQLVRFLRDDDGATAVEYAVVLALILMAAIAGVATFGTQAGALWGGVDADLVNAGFGN